jgi:NAD(P)-dependent dehydrogenase (short-subunit alcohol dehydrogenase family)
VTHAFDATAPRAYPDLAEWLVADGHPYDILVHTPGGGLHALAVSDQRLRAQLMAGQGHVPFWEIADDVMDRVLALGVKSAINCCKYLAPALIRQGRGSLVVMGSASGIPGQAVNADAAYCAEKGAVISYVLVISRELQPHGVAANVLLPGLTRTTITAGYPHWEAHPTILSPEAAVPAAVFLAEQTADGVTGQIFSAREYLARTQTG